MKVTSDRSTVTVLLGLPAFNRSQARSSSLTQGPESLPSSLMVAGREPFSTVIFSIIRNSSPPASPQAHLGFHALRLLQLASKASYYHVDTRGSTDSATDDSVTL